MKREVEFPKLAELQEVGRKKGFTIEPVEAIITQYQVIITSEDGKKQAAWVNRVRGKGAERYVMDTMPWGATTKTRLRISIGKKVNVIGNKLSWKMADPNKELPREIHAHMLERGQYISCLKAQQELGKDLDWLNVSDAQNEIREELGYPKEGVL